MSSTLQNSITVAPVGKKTREEVLADFENDLVRFESMSLKLYGHDQPLQFSRDMVPFPQRLHFRLPEYSIYL